MIVAADRRQARQIKGYIRGFLETPVFRALVESETKDAIRLTNGIDVEIHTCSFRSTRGYTAVAVIAEEVAFWRSDDSTNPDTEVINALLPTLATTGGLFVGLSSPYARRGELYRAYERHFGKDGDTLVLAADTRTFNPSVPREVVDRAFEEDESAAWSEYGRDGEIRFRTDVEGFVPLEVVRAAVDSSVYEREPQPGIRYFGFADPASGSGSDSMTFGISHKEPDGTVVLDLLLERKPPFSPAAVVEEIAAGPGATTC